jgi:DNA invertase Pin-like site-specific DNA recombinase
MLLIGFTRVSTGKQELGPEAQESEIRAYCEKDRWCQEHGCEISEVRHEPHISAKHGRDRRLFLAQIYAEMKDNHRGWDGIIVWKLDRLWRNKAEEDYGWYMIDRYKIPVISVTEPIDRSTAAGRLMTGIMGEFRAYELEQIGERVILHSRYLASIGLLPCGLPPLGFGYIHSDKDKKIPGKVIVDPQRADDAVAVFETFCECGGNYRLTAKRLNSTGILTAKGNLWLGWTVQQIVNSPYYRRQVAYEDLLIDSDQIPELIPPSLLAHADALLANRQGYKTRSTQNVYAFSSMLTCGACGGRMVYQGSAQRAAYWACKNRYAHQICTGRGIGHGRLTRLVGAAVGRLVDPHREEIIGSKSAVPEVQVRNEGKIRALEQRRRKVQEAHMAGLQTLEEAAEENRRILAEIERLRKDERPGNSQRLSVGQFRELIEKLDTYWQAMTEAERHKVLVLISSGITVYSAARTESAAIELYGELDDGPEVIRVSEADIDSDSP